MVMLSAMIITSTMGTLITGRLTGAKRVTIIIHATTIHKGGTIKTNGGIKWQKDPNKRIMTT